MKLNKFTPVGLALLALAIVLSVVVVWLWTWLLCWSLMVQFHMRYVVLVLLALFGMNVVARTIGGKK